MAQKWMVTKANLAAKPVIVASQLLESMVESPRPTRAEMTDVANAIYDVVDALLLRSETTVGKFVEKVGGAGRRCSVKASLGYSRVVCR